LTLLRALVIAPWFQFLALLRAPLRALVEEAQTLC
jgi:hypothetical protein